MKRQTFLAYAGLMVAVALVATVVHGRLTNRWGGYDAQLKAAAATLDHVPESFGAWELISETEFTDRVKGILNCAGYVNRTYTNNTGDTVSMAMIVGPPGPTSSHVAEMCYTTQGYQHLKGSEFHIKLADGQDHEFHEDNFESPDAYSKKLQVCYSWWQNDRWRRPAIPRVTFGGRAYLYKIQVASYFDRDLAKGEEGPCQAFLKDLVPELQKTLLTRPKS